MQMVTFNDNGCIFAAYFPLSKTHLNEMLCIHMYLSNAVGRVSHAQIRNLAA